MTLLHGGTLRAGFFDMVSKQTKLEVDMRVRGLMLVVGLAMTVGCEKPPCPDGATVFKTRDVHALYRNIDNTEIQGQFFGIPITIREVLKSDELKSAEYCSFPPDGEVLHGPLRVFDGNRELVRLLEFKNGKLDGKFMLHELEKDRIMETSFKDGQLHGDVRITVKGQVLHESGPWENGKWTGSRKDFHKDGKKKLVAESATSGREIEAWDESGKLTMKGDGDEVKTFKDGEEFCRITLKDLLINRVQIRPLGNAVYWFDAAYENGNMTKITQYESIDGKGSELGRFLFERGKFQYIAPPDGDMELMELDIPYESECAEPEVVQRTHDECVRSLATVMGANGQFDYGVTFPARFRQK